MFTIRTDKSRNLVNVHMSGFLEPAEVQRFLHERQAAVEAMGLGSGEYYILIDTESCTIQSQEVVAALMHAIGESPFRSKRLAVVRRNNLARMQTRRILSVRGDAELFSSVADAERWLFEDPQGSSGAS